MTTPEINALLENYVAAWSEPEAGVRQALLESIWEVAGTYTDPLSHATSRAGLDEIIADFLRKNAGARFTLDRPPDHHHHHLRFYWTLHLANGRKTPGMDYGELSPAGKLVKIVGFF